MSSIEDNKIIAQRWIELISEHKIEEICEITAPTWKIHGSLPGLPLGPEGVRKLFDSFGPIQEKLTIEDIIAEGDKVVVRATNTCIQESFFGIPSRGRQQIFTATFIHYIADGKIIETWRNADDLGRVLQLGARIEPGVSE
ncbi:ester cyclase [uncultured Nostoc sp.]|uniref:ester cyclase n=1 Tax=uncultured Nostoc sp. TaxID=340711 RepID=UPI0035C9AF97